VEFSYVMSYPASAEPVAWIDDDPEVARIAALELEMLRLGVPLDDEPPLGFGEAGKAEVAEMAAALRALVGEAEERIRTGRPTDDSSELLAAAGWIVKARAGQLSLGDLVPSEEELNADPELEAWWAGIPGVPPPRMSAEAPPRSPSLAYVPPVLRVRTRSREQRPRQKTRSTSAASRDGPEPDSDPLAPSPARAGLDVVPAKAA
jgi:hypothetical protein